MMRSRTILALTLLLMVPVAGLAQSSPNTPTAGRVLEDVIARVNNEIITLSDLERAREAFMREIEQECSRSGCTEERRAELIQEGETNLLRDLIDQSLMVQRAKDVGISVETDLIKYMDRVRQENNLKDMEELEKAVESTGLVFEEWKDGIRKQMLQQELIRREIRPNFTEEQVQEYYDQHKDDFVRKERVFLAEIFCTIEGKPESEWPAVEEKCKTLRRRVVEGGEDFGKMAQAFSDGSTASQGGDLGGDGFGRDDLAPELAEPVFKLKRGEVSDVIRVQTGYLILRLVHRYEEGLQPIENVKGEIQNRLFMQGLRPELRKYLTELREQSYVMLKPGYVDAAGVETTPIIEIAAKKEEEEGEEVKRRKRILGIPMPW